MRSSASNEDLQSSNRRLDLERRLLATVLESVTTGVLAFDADGKVTRLQPGRARAALASATTSRSERCGSGRT